ncbi:Nucleotidyltransferase domain protein [compost metagenome]
MIDVTPQEFAIVRDILRRIVPDREVMVFGSRSKGTAKPFSDLDLAIMGAQPVSLSVCAELAHEFDESPLPFKVDLVDWASSSASFRQAIASQLVPLEMP